MQATYEVKGMACEGCAKSVSKAIADRLPGVQTDVSVQNACVIVQGEHDEATIQQAVEDAGFEFGGVKS